MKARVLSLLCVLAASGGFASDGGDSLVQWDCGGDDPYWAVQVPRLEGFSPARRQIRCHYERKWKERFSLPGGAVSAEFMESISFDTSIAQGESIFSGESRCAGRARATPVEAGDLFGNPTARYDCLELDSSRFKRVRYFKINDVEHRLNVVVRYEFGGRIDMDARRDDPALVRRLSKRKDPNPQIFTETISSLKLKRPVDLTEDAKPKIDGGAAVPLLR
ncbi:MAG: hypothetical protein HY922_00090 [Elusimicrobia bacterium]|nr:hypothetical protein [Elusimicrobiota bacterium]